MSNYMIISLVFVFLILGMFFLFMERKKPDIKTILLIVTLCCIASVGRIIFNFIPQVQPVTAIVIIAGVCLGGRWGFLTGALSAFVSNLVLGQGPWTPWQMLGWGTVGLLAGAFSKYMKKDVTPSEYFESDELYQNTVKGKGRKGKMSFVILILFSFFSAFLYSLIVDINTIAYIGEGLNLNMALSVFGAGLLFNISHAIGNVIFIVLLYPILSKKLTRIKTKYGV